MEIKKIGVIGIGSMGNGIAQVAAEAGFDVIVQDINDEIIAAGMKNIQRMIRIAIRFKRILPEEKDNVLARIKTTTSLDDFSDVDLVIEAAPEIVELKKSIFEKLDSVCPDETIFATNTSSLSVVEIGTSTNRQDRFLGLHFFNPPTETQLVEVIRTLLTSDESFDAAFETVKSFKKTPIEAKDTPGFIVNRLMVLFLNEGARMAEEGLASPQDIDKAWKLATGMPKGPCEMIDMIGVDVATHVGDSLYNEFRERLFHCPPILHQMRRAGLLGKKSGKGFYNYSK
ncbi:3-hydroxyacyl-CoA dehydrogenase family protein [bacterium]|nr:3-hydroxyacyl-CoA dehydrogenase family protein [bacterium]